MTEQLATDGAAEPYVAADPLWPAGTGLLAAGSALGVAEFATVLTGPEGSPVLAVGQGAIDLSPRPVEGWAIDTFGTYDKVVLVTGILAVVALLAAMVGRLAVRNRPAGLGAVAVFGAVAVAAVRNRANADLADLLPALAGTGAGLGVLALLTRERPARPAPGEQRRQFLAVGLLAAATGAAGLVLRPVRFSAAGSRARVRVPSPADPAPPLPLGSRLPELGPFTTPNADFYRVDTSLHVPQVPAEDWTLRIHGMVDRPMTLTFDDLLRRPLIERDITLCCVSNEIGGDLVGTARWSGAPLREILREVRVHPGADQVVSRSADGMTIGTPVAALTDGRDAMLAVTMNGAPLPLRHGFPVRMVVPGLYGYVSACKWITEMELTRFDDVDAYWVEHGWARPAPIRTASRIDVPRSGDSLSPGTVTVAGVAWAQHRGIDRVEVRVDGGDWHEAELATVPSVDTWRQWRYRWSAGEGEHTLQVRAADGDGKPQEQEETPPYPSGATGYHTVDVTVS